MIRFIDLRGLIEDNAALPDFAFFNSVTDKFVDFGGRQHFYSREDLRIQIGASLSPEQADRYLRKLPEWVP